MSRAVADRYQPVLVALHWLIGLMIIGLLWFGYFVLANTPSSNPQKINILALHATGGMAVLTLMIVRVAVRLSSAKPPPAPTGSAWADRLAPIAHLILYLIVFGMIAGGWLTGFFVRASFAAHGSPLPGDFSVLPTFRIHATLAVLLVLLIAGHVSAALYHQLVLKDELFRRMGFGRRTVA